MKSVAALLFLLLNACAHPTLTTGVVMSAGVTANALLKLDTDAGGYRDQPLTMDKLAHAAVADVLTTACLNAGGHHAGCPLIVTLGGAGFEVTQGYISLLDIGADGVGGLAALSFHLLCQRRCGKRER